MDKRIKLGRFDMSIKVDNIRIRMLPNGGFFGMGERSALPTYSRSDYELHFVLAEHMELECENGKLHMERDDICVLPCGMLPTVSDECCKWQHISLRFNAKKLQKSDGQYGDAVLARLESVQVLRNMTSLSLILREMISETYTSSLFSEDRIAALLTLIFSSLFERLIGDGTDNSSEKKLCSGELLDMRAAMIKEFFVYNYMNDIVLSDLASQLKLSEKQTQRLIQRIFGNTFKEQLTYHRLSAAKRLLTDSNEAVKDIAGLVGYSSYGGFYSLFSRETGVTPVEYRRNNRHT